MITTTAPAFTVADLADENEEFEQMIDKARPGGCRSVEFIDDNFKRGYRALEFKVSIIAGHTYDEDGCSPRYESYPVSVAVLPTMSFRSVVFLLVSEIHHLIAS